MEEIVFNEDTHTYTRQGSEYISVTTLLKKYGLSPDYGAIDPKVLQRAANRGTFIHKQLENYIKGNKVENQLVIQGFVDYVNNRQIDLTTASSEELVYNDTYKVAGTIDFQYRDNNELIIADFKTTSSIHWGSVTWQLSIYNYIKCNGDQFEYYMHTPKVFHIIAQTLTKEASYSVKTLPLIPFEEIEKLLQANLADLPYTYVQDVSNIISDSESDMYSALYTELQAHKSAIKIIEDKLSTMNKQILKGMEQFHEHNITFKGLSATYVENKGRSTLDVVTLDNFLKGHQQSIENFYVQGPGSVSLKITVLGGNDTKDE